MRPRRRTSRSKSKSIARIPRQRSMRATMTTRTTTTKRLMKSKFDASTAPKKLIGVLLAVRPQRPQLTHIHRAQKAAVNTMGLALAQVEREANMIGVVVLACADPELGGTIKVARYVFDEVTMFGTYADSSAVSLKGPTLWATRLLICMDLIGRSTSRSRWATSLTKYFVSILSQSIFCF